MGNGKLSPELVADEILNQLIHDKIIQVAKWKPNGRVKTCRLSYFIRDHWSSNSNTDNDNFLGSSCSSSPGTGKIFRLADHLDTKSTYFSHIHTRDNLTASALKHFYRQLVSLLSFDSREGPLPGEEIGKFLQRGIRKGCFKMLRVLDLEGVFRPKLPESIGNLVELRYLGLRWTYLEVLPSSVDNLANLQTLDLKHTTVRSLPRSLWKMQHLRHLYLSDRYHMPPLGASFPPNIQTLWGAFVDEDIPVKNGLDRLINLTKLGLLCRSTLTQQKELAGWILKLKHLEYLRIRSIEERSRPSNLYLEPLSGLENLYSIYLLGRLENPLVVAELPRNLSEITLSLSGLTEDPMPKLGKLLHLRILNFFSGSYTGKTMVCYSNGFPLLRTLKLWKLKQLEEWIVEGGALTILREVEIRDCSKLKMIPDGLKNLMHCRELKLAHMPLDFNARVTLDQGEDWHKIAHIPSVIVEG